jgi:hypothetical protein
MSRADVAVGAVLLAGALWLGTWYVPQVVAAGGRPHFYQNYFGAAVMLACGHGFVNPVAASLPELQRFLNLEQDQIACDDRLASAPRIELNPLQRAYRYLMTTVAWTWRIRGQVAWSALPPLYGIFFASSIVLLYAVFRQGMGPMLAAILATVIAVSPLHIAYLPQLRDYSKMPFVLALVFLAARMVRGPSVFRRTLKLAAIAGVVTGVGMGYRNDLMIAVPAFVAVLLIFIPHDGFPRGWRNVAAAAVYAVSFLIALSPMWSIYRIGGGSSSQHLLVLGLSEPFNSELGLDNGGMYEWSYGYRDEYAHAIVSGHATRRLGAQTSLRLYGPEYDRAGMDYLRQVSATFPADMVTRLYSSTLRVLELPYNAKLIPPHDQFLHIPRTILVARDRFQRWLAPAWLPLVGIALLLLTAASVRVGLFVISLVVYLSAYPAIQFGERHYFHLEFVSWWAVGFLAALAGGYLLALRKREGAMWTATFAPAGGWPRAFARAALVMAVVAGLLVAPLWWLRTYQQEHLGALFRDLQNLEVDYGAMTSVPAAGQQRRVSVPLGDELEDGRSHAVRSSLIVAEFGGPSCDALKLDATFVYESSSSRFDFSRSLPIQPPLSATPLRVLFPAYSHTASADAASDSLEGSHYRFAGIDLPEAAAHCLMRLGRISDATQLPVLFELRLPPGWENADLFHTVVGWESRVNPETVPTVYTAPANLPVGRQILMRPLEPLDAKQIAKQSPTLDTGNTVWTNSGVGGVGGKGPFLYLFEMQPRPLKAGALALVQGTIARGGISVGLVKDGRWHEQVGVLSSGDFTAVVRVPTDGDYALVVANNLPGASLTNNLTINRAGWVLDAP